MFVKFGGEREIRTLETLLTPTRVPGVRIQPLCHLSAYKDFKYLEAWTASKIVNVEHFVEHIN
jgi:hypothetical protein